MTTLDEYAERIRGNMVNELQSRIEIGKDFIAAKDEYPGRFISWCRTEFPDVSQGTIANYMALAALSESRPDLMDSGMRLSVMYQLGKAEANIVELVELADKQGVPVTPELVSSVRNVPEYLREVYAVNGGRVDVMLRTAETLADAPQEVVDLCKRHQVPIPETVEFLSNKYNLYKEGKSTSYPEIEEDGGLNGEGWSMPLSSATPMDLRAYDKDRSKAHKDSSTPVYEIYRCAAGVDESGLQVSLPIDLWQELIGRPVLVIIRYERVNRGG